MEAYRRLKLETILNVRDLGGWPMADGGTTKYGVFLRSAIPEELSEKDRQTLRDYDLSLAVDLRGSFEIKGRPDPFARESWLEYKNIPMFDEAAAGGQNNYPSAFEKGFFWGDQYIVMAESHKDWMKTVLDTLAGARGAALFHCTTGKDRTGIVTAVLLGLCGVAREDIVADYCVSQCYLLPIYVKYLLPDRHIAAGTSLDAPFFSTAPANMETLLDHFDKQYGGINGFVAACGVSAETVNRLKARLGGTERK